MVNDCPGKCFGRNANIEQGTPNIEHRSGMLNVKYRISNIEVKCELMNRIPNTEV